MAKPMSTERAKEPSGSYEDLALGERVGAVRISVHVRPRSSKSGLGGVREGALEVRLTSPPVDGEANAAVIELLARALGLPRAAVEVTAGHSSRRKTVRLRGVTRAALEAVIAGAPAP
jgi:uncharacterized protein (TIGR00251 family)